MVLKVKGIIVAIVPFEEWIGGSMSEENRKKLVSMLKDLGLI
jgi:hypothetical protein